MVKHSKFEEKNTAQSNVPSCPVHVFTFYIAICTKIHFSAKQWNPKILHQSPNQENSTLYKLHCLNR